MSNQRRSDIALSDLDLTQNGLKLVTLTFGITLYTGTSFYDCPDAILRALGGFLERCPPDQVRYYATETMSVHKPVTKRVLSMPHTWLKPGAPRKDYVALELKSGEEYQDAPQFKYHIWAVDKSTQANLISLAYPAAWGIEQTDQMLGVVQEMADIFPFTSGLAGFSFERSHYVERVAETHAWSMSMRHPGVDIVRIPVDAKAAGTDGVKGVGWLTLLGSDLLGRLGGVRTLRATLPSEIDLIGSRYGVIVKAGQAPSLGDVNRGDTLPHYRQVYQVVAPWIQTAAQRSMVFHLPPDRTEKTAAWYARLGT